MSDLAVLTRMAQDVSDIYADRFGIDRDDLWHLGKLTEEMGEVSAAFLKVRGQGRGEGSAEDLQDELADLFGFLLIFAAREGVDLGDALRKKWGKYLPKDA